MFTKKCFSHKLHSQWNCPDESKFITTHTAVAKKLLSLVEEETGRPIRIKSAVRLATRFCEACCIKVCKLYPEVQEKKRIRPKASVQQDLTSDSVELSGTENVETCNCPGAVTMKAVKELHESSILCDLELFGQDEKSVNIHKVMLMARSPIYRSLYQKGKFHVKRLVFPKVSIATLQSLVAYLYGEQLIITAGNVKEIQKLATTLKIDSLIKDCEDYKNLKVLTRSQLKKVLPEKANTEDIALKTSEDKSVNLTVSSSDRKLSKRKDLVENGEVSQKVGRKKARTSPDATCFLGEVDSGKGITKAFESSSLVTLSNTVDCTLTPTVQSLTSRSLMKDVDLRKVKVGSSETDEDNESGLLSSWDSPEGNVSENNMPSEKQDEVMAKYEESLAGQVQDHAYSQPRKTVSTNNVVPKISTNQVTVEKQGLQLSFTCPRCSKIFSSLQAWKKHLLIHSEKDFDSRTCKTAFGTTEDLLLHTNQCHEQPPNKQTIVNRFYSSTCKSMLKSILKTSTPVGQPVRQCPEKQPIKQLLSTAKPSFTRTCRTCCQRFETAIAWSKHKCIISYRTCNLCLSKFLNVSQLKDHMKKVHSKALVCRYCNKVFGAREKLHAHENVHLAKIVYEDLPKRFAEEAAVKAKLGLQQKDDMLHTSGLPEVNPTILAKAISERVMSEVSVLYHKCRCFLCGENCQDRNCLKLHVDNHSQQAPYGCCYCNKQFLEYGFLEAHGLLKHIAKDPSFIRRHNSTFQMVGTCQICNKTMHGDRDILYHKRLHAGLLPFKCAVCSKYFTSKARMERHKSLHKKMMKYHCPKCGEMFAASDYVLKHLKTHENQEVIHCDKCDKVFKNRIALNCHLKNTHQMVLMKKCYFCEMTFKEDWKLKEHVVAAHPIKTRNKCRFCDQRFQSRRKLHVHENFKHYADIGVTSRSISSLNRDENKVPKTDDSENNVEVETASVCHRCFLCGLVLSDNDELKTHVKFHNQNSPFQCYLCNQQFVEYSFLETHGLSRHPGIDPEIRRGRKSDNNSGGTCPVCHKHLPHSRAKVYHEKLHSGLLPFKCEMCDKQFSTVSRLNAHKVSHVNQYSCTICGKILTTSGGLKKHMAGHGERYVVKHEDKHIAELEKEQAVSCNYCEKTFKNQVTLNVHLKTFHRLILWKNCPYCSQKFENIIERNKHTKEAHPAKIRFKCRFCHRGFQTRIKQKTHENARHLSKIVYDDSSAQKSSLTENLVEIAADLLPAEVVRETMSHFRCFLCGEAYSEQESLQNHVASHNQSGPFPCRFCKKKFISYSTLETHGLLAHVANESSKKIPPEKQSIGLCEFCSAYLYGQRDTWYHQKLHAGLLPHKCSECALQFSSSMRLRVHEKKHSGICVFCEKCGQVTETEDALRSHMLKHIDKQMHCDQCNKTFKSDSALNLHMRKAHRETKWKQCIYCPLSFTTATELAAHRRSAHPPHEIYKCKFCLKSFSKKNILHRHEQLHMHTRETYMCDVCGKVCRTKASLKTHQLMIHATTPLPLYRCNMCGQKFKWKKNLKIHILQHQGTERYWCKMCERGFIFPYLLRKHVAKVHGEEFLETCTLCGKQFLDVAELQKHLGTHQPFPSLTCTSCHQPFGSEALLHAHKCTVQQEEMELAVVELFG